MRYSRINAPVAAYEIACHMANEMNIAKLAGLRGENPREAVREYIRRRTEQLLEEWGHKRR